MYTPRAHLPTGLRTPAHDANGNIAPHWAEVLILAFGSILDVVLLWERSYEFINLVSPMILGGAASWGVWRLVRQSPGTVWTALFAARAATIAYLGVGSLVTEFGGSVILEIAQVLYIYSVDEAAKSNSIFMIGFFILIGSVKLASIIHPAPPLTHAKQAFGNQATFKLGVLYLSVGLGFTLFVYLPTQLLWLNVTVPGSIALLARALGAVGVFLIALWAIGRGGAAYLWVAVTVTIQVAIALTLMEKQTILMAVLLVGLAFLINGVTVVRLLTLATALVIALAIVTPAIMHARIAHAMTHQDLLGGTIGERLSNYRAYIEGERLSWYQEDAQGSSFVRLNYLAPSSFVITQFDYGMPSETVVNGLYALIPRVIWPDKPILSAAGSDLNKMLTGSDQSSAGVAVFADLYWNFGWGGLILFLPMGFFIWWASYTAYAIVEARDWLLMPFVLVVFMIGTSVDNPFVLMWFSPAVVSIILLFLLKRGAELLDPTHSFRGVRAY